MEPNARYLLVGVFTLVCGVLAFFMLTWMNGADTGDTQQNYPVVFDESISGLSLGSEVQYLGVPVGTVIDMTLRARERPQVEVTIAVDEYVPINSSTQANLKMLGVTGLAVIELIPGDDTAPTENSEIVLQGQGSLITRLSNSSGDITRDLSAVLGGVNQLLSSENVKSMTRILDNTAQASDRLGAIAENADELTRALLVTNAELRDALQQINTLVRNTEQDVLPDLDETLENFNAISRSLARALEQNDVGQGLGSAHALSDQLIITLAEIERLMGQLQQRPSSILYQQDERGVELNP